MTTRLTANGAKIQALEQRHVGDPYVWGDDGPHAEDCSGLFYEVMGPLGMNVQAIVHAGRLTANDYYHLGTRISAPSQVGDYFVELVPGTDHAHHIGLFYGTDANGVPWTVEARGVAYGVVMYRLDDPDNGITARHGIWMRLPGVNLGPFWEVVNVTDTSWYLGLIAGGNNSSETAFAALAKSKQDASRIIPAPRWAYKQAVLDDIQAAIEAVIVKHTPTQGNS